MYLIASRGLHNKDRIYLLACILDDALDILSTNTSTRAVHENLEVTHIPPTYYIIVLSSIKMFIAIPLEPLVGAWSSLVNVMT